MAPRLAGAQDDLLSRTTFDGYYCDFDRNFAFGKPGDDVRRAHETVWRATQPSGPPPHEHRCGHHDLEQSPADPVVDQ